MDGEIQTFWSGSDANVHTCQCGIDNYCVRPDLECNCDANVAVPLTDNGTIVNLMYRDPYFIILLIVYRKYSTKKCSSCHQIEFWKDDP